MNNINSDINKLIIDNYASLGIYLFIFAIALVLIYFCIINFMNVIRKYNNAKKESLAIYKDVEIYDDNTIDTTIYYDNNKKRFINNMKSKYDNYNKSKAKYIQNTYNKLDDDVIDDKILYNKNDTYDYHK